MRQLLCSCDEFRRMVLDEEMSFKEVMSRYGVSYPTVHRYAKQYLSDEERKEVADRSHKDVSKNRGGGRVAIQQSNTPGFFQRLEEQQKAQEQPKLTMKRTIIALTGSYAQYSVNFNDKTVTIVGEEQDMCIALDDMEALIRELTECKGILEGTIQA